MNYSVITTMIATSTESDSYESYLENITYETILNISEIFEKDRTTEINESYHILNISEINRGDKIIELSTYINYETNNIISDLINKCIIHELSNGFCELVDLGNHLETKDLIISTIKEYIEKGSLDYILLNTSKENNKGIIIKYDNIIYHIIYNSEQISRGILLLLRIIRKIAKMIIYQ